MKIDKKQEQFEKYKRNKADMLQNNYPIKYIRLKKTIRPLLRAVLFLQRKIKGQTVEFISKEIPKSNRPMVFVVSHIGKYDFEIVNEMIPQHFHVIASDFMNMTGNINGLFMKANGVIFMDIDSKEDRENSRKMMMKVLERGDNMMIFPEGTWNISENEIIRDMHFGAVDIALEKNAVIVPIAVEQYGKRFVVNTGEIYDPAVEARAVTDKAYPLLEDKSEKEAKLKLRIKLETTTKLRDRLATLKFAIWEREGISHRQDIPYDYWKEFIMDRWAEWPHYSMDEQIRNGCFPPAKKEYYTMLEEISQMTVKKENAFLFNNR